MHGDDRACGSDQGGDRVIHIISTAGGSGACPHVRAGIAFYITAEFAKGFARNGDWVGVAAAVHDDVQVMHAPVNQGAAACDCLGGEGSAQTRDAAVRAEGDIDMIDVTQAAIVYHFFYAPHAVIKAVDHTNVECHPGFVLNLLHFLRFGQGSGAWLFTQYMFACPHAVDADGGMQVVGHANRDSCDLRVF